MKRATVRHLLLFFLLSGLIGIVLPGCQTALDEENQQGFGHLQSVPSPEWAQETVIYEVFVRAFSPEGTFARVTARLPELKDLGVGTIWLMPIHPVGQAGRKGNLGSPYSVRDYLAINPEFGTSDDLMMLVKRAHELGMEVILDWVANHSANDHVEMGRHPEWFARDANGVFTREVADWWDVTDFDYANPGLRQYMVEAMLYWVNTYNIDGYRCDVAGMVPDSFWVEARAALHKAKPSIFLLAEWEDPLMHLGRFDATYDWTLYHTMKDIRAGKAPAEKAIDVILQKESEYPKGSLRLRFIENHDEQRAARVFGLDGYRPYATFIFTVSGIPMLYAGQEVADTVKPQLFDKVEVNWEGNDTQARSFYRELIAMRRGHPVLADGRTVKIPNDRPNEIVTFARLSNDGMAVVALNLSDREVEATLHFPDELREWRGNTVFSRYETDSENLLEKAYFKMGFGPFESAIYFSKDKDDEK